MASAAVAAAGHCRAHLATMYYILIIIAFIFLVFVEGFVFARNAWMHLQCARERFLFVHILHSAAHPLLKT